MRPGIGKAGNGPALERSRPVMRRRWSSAVAGDVPGEGQILERTKSFRGPDPGRHYSLRDGVTRFTGNTIVLKQFDLTRLELVGKDIGQSLVQTRFGNRLNSI